MLHENTDSRRFNQIYCGVDPHAQDADYLKAGGLLPIPEPKVGRVRKLVGTGAPGKNGQLLKMSKSLNNAIYLSDDADTIRKKIMGMYTDPNRLRATDPGTVENNPLWIFHDTFNADKAWVEEAKQRYREGSIGDVECKKRLVDILIAFIEPIAERRKAVENEKDHVQAVLRQGAERANQVAEETLRLVKTAMRQLY